MMQKWSVTNTLRDGVISTFWSLSTFKCLYLKYIYIYNYGQSQSPHINTINVLVENFHSTVAGSSTKMVYKYLVQDQCHCVEPKIMKPHQLLGNDLLYEKCLSEEISKQLFK